MSLPNNHIDHLVKKAVDSAEVAPSANFWNKADMTIQNRIKEIERLNGKKWRKRAFYLGGVAFLFFLSTTYLFLTKENKDVLSGISAPKNSMNIESQRKQNASSEEALASTSPTHSFQKNLPSEITTSGHSDYRADEIKPNTPKNSTQKTSEETTLLNSQNIDPTYHLESIPLDVVDEKSTNQVETSHEVIDSTIAVGYINVYALKYLVAPFEITSRENQHLQIPQKLFRQFSASLYSGFGGNHLATKDTRTYDSQVPADVRVKSGFTSTLGIACNYRLNKHWGVALGIEKLSTKSGVVSHYFPDTTGTGIIIDPEETGEEENEEEGTIGNGNTTVQASTLGYNVVTNFGVVHVTHAKNADCTLTAKSYQEIKYVNVPIQLYFVVPMHRCELTFGAGGVYHQLTNATAYLQLNDANGTSYQNSKIDGLKKSFWSSRMNASFSYHLSSHWALQAGIDVTLGIKPLNASTPFSTRMNTFVGRTGLIFNF